MSVASVLLVVVIIIVFVIIVAGADIQECQPRSSRRLLRFDTQFARSVTNARDGATSTSRPPS